MMSLELLASELEVSERTLRRAAVRGTLRAERTSPRRLSIDFDEHDYAVRHWRVLAALLGALRTQQNVRTAILFGSVARGNDTNRSDVDLLIRFRRETLHDRMSVVEVLEASLARRVQIVMFEEAEHSALLLADVLRDGRVIVDRDGDWAALERRSPRIHRAARIEDERFERESWQVLERLEELI